MDAEKYRVPHGPDEPCTCDGCWACAGHVVGCTCDVDWERLYAHGTDDGLGSGLPGWHALNSPG